MKRVCKMLVLALSLVAVGCAGIAAKKEKTPKWVGESAEKISEEITSGQFVIDDVVYQFPMELQYWLDNGWHVSNNYDNADEFRLKVGHISNQFELFNEDGDYVKVSVYNDSYEDASIEDCMVYSLYMSAGEVDVVLPKGITKRNKPDDILDAYGEPDAKDDEGSEFEVEYFFEDENLGQCYVHLDAVDYSYADHPLTSISFGIISAQSYWDAMVKNHSQEYACEYVIDATMKASFVGDIEDYVGCALDSRANANLLYESEVEYFAEYVMYCTEINSDYIGEETWNRLLQISKDVLAKLKWDVKSVDIGHFNEGTITMELYPTDFFYVVEEDVVGAMDAFYEKYIDTDFEAMSDEEYAVVEEEYADMLLDAMEKNMSAVGTLDAVEKVYDVDLDNPVFSQEDWVEIDSILMDMVGEE